MDREHPDGIDFLIVNAAIAGSYTTGIESCAALRLSLSAPSGLGMPWTAVPAM